MTGMTTAWIVFAFVSGGALFGMVLRRVLPEDHLNNNSKDVVKLGMGLLATMAALVLGLLIASAKSQYDAQRDGLDQISAKFILLDAGLAQYGPEASGARDLLRRTVASALTRIWPQGPSQTSSLTGARYDGRGQSDLRLGSETLAPERHAAKDPISSSAASSGTRPDTLAASRAAGEPRCAAAISGDPRVLAHRSVRQLRTPFATERDSHRRSFRMRAFGFGSDLSYPGTGTTVRGTAAAFQRSDASRFRANWAVAFALQVDVEVNIGPPTAMADRWIARPREKT